MHIYPKNILKYNIYDIFHNDCGEYVILCAGSENLNISIVVNNERIYANKYFCSHNHTSVYIFNNTKYFRDIQIQVDNDAMSTEVNKYTSFNDEVIMSTCVKNEDNYILQWIQYHQSLGIKRFIIYDHKDGDSLKHHSYYVPSKDKQSNLSIKLKSLIDSGIVQLIYWPYEYKFQMSQQTHSIHAFKSSKWIGLFDIDEYINIKTQSLDVSLFFNQFLIDNKIDQNEIGGLMILSKLFHNPDNISDKEFNFLNCSNCSEILSDRYEKIFVNPKVVFNFSCHAITNGIQHKILDKLMIYINHYFFLNKTDRGLIRLPFCDDSIKNILLKIK